MITWMEDTLAQYIAPIAIAYFVAWIVHRLSDRMVGRFMQMSGYAPEGIRLRAERRRTLQDLLSSVVSFIAFLVATLFALARFIDPDTLIWMVGLFSAAFGLGARPLISDFLTGMGFIFEDTFDVGEKVEIMGVEGVIERIRLRTTMVRAPTGELFVIPNGEVRIIRNFSRGQFSSANITIKIASGDVNTALPVLDALGQEAVSLLPNILEPWQVICPTGALTQAVELTLVVKTRFGAAAETRMHLLALVQERLAQAGVALAG